MDPEIPIALAIAVAVATIASAVVSVVAAISAERARMSADDANKRAIAAAETAAVAQSNTATSLAEMRAYLEARPARERRMHIAREFLHSLFDMLSEVGNGANPRLSAAHARLIDVERETLLEYGTGNASDANIVKVMRALANTMFDVFESGQMTAELDGEFKTCIGIAVERWRDARLSEAEATQAVATFAARIQALRAPTSTT